MGALSTHDQPNALGPGVEADEPDELGDFGAVTVCAVGVDGWVPATGGHADDAVSDAFVELVAERELDVAVDAFGGQPVRSTSAVGTNQDPTLCPGRVVTDIKSRSPRRRELRECPLRTGSAEFSLRRDRHQIRNESRKAGEPL